MADAPEREIAYQTYINEVMPNGNTRLDNIILCNAGDRAEQHIATQIDIAFQAGWSARADLATPLDDPRVKALVEAAKAAEAVLAQYYVGNKAIAKRKLRKALSALEENK